jgi:hypothetical protein
MARDRRLTDVGGRLAAWRESQGVWFAIVAGRIGWGMSFGDAVRDALRAWN